MKPFHRASVFALAAAFLAAGGIAFGQGKPAMSDRLEIRGVLPPYVISLPSPTWHGKPFRPEIEELPGMTFLRYKPQILPSGAVRTSKPYTVMQELYGVRSVEDARAHFKLNWVDLDAAEEQRGRKIEVLDMPYGKMMVVDLARLGWIPGNVHYYYFIAPKPGERVRTLYVGPTFFIDYDFAALELRK